MSSRAVRRARGLSMLEVLVALSLLAFLSLTIALLAGQTAHTIDETTLLTRAEAAARYEMEGVLAADFTTLCQPGNYYDRWRRTYVAGGTPPKFSSHFEVTAPGCPPGNAYGTITVREPTAAEAPSYRSGAGPAYPYPGGWATSAFGGLPRAPNPNPITVLIIFVSVDIPATQATAPVHFQLQSWRFGL